MELLIEKSPYYAKSRYNDGFSAIIITRFHCTILVLVQDVQEKMELIKGLDWLLGGLLSGVNCNPFCYPSTSTNG